MSKERPGFSGAMRSAMGALAASYSGVPSIATDAASSALKKMKNSSGRSFATSRADEERLKRRSRKMQNDLQKNMESSVKRKLNSMSGSQNNRKLGLKVAQFIPGKGLEVAGAQVENDPAIYCSLGLKGEKHVDPLEETFSTIKGRQVSMDFAFKLINDNSKLLDHDKETRVTTMNCFRHVNPDSFNKLKSGWSRNVGINSFHINSVVIDPAHAGEFSASQGNPEVFCSFSQGIGGNTATGTVNLQSTSSPGVYEIQSVTVDTGGEYSSPASISFSIGQYTTELIVPTNVSVNMYQNRDEAKIAANAKWHSTLGPDASLIRSATRGLSASSTNFAGTWRGASYGALDTSSLTAPANSLISPYRYPNDMEIMYSRLNRQLLENYGWLLNPYKFTNFQHNSERTDAVNTPPLSTANLEVWQNPGAQYLDFMEGGSVTEEAKAASFPARVNREIGVSYGSPSAPQMDHNGFEWHSQFGPGKLAYQFSNDGTNPVCIDICVVGIKKDSPIPVHFMKSFCNYNYAIHKFANAGSTNLNGFQSTNQESGLDIDLDFGSEEWHKNAKLPFMPDVCFKNPQSYLEAVDWNPTGSGSGYYDAAFRLIEQGKKNPFKVIKRDQFIVSSGSSRAWNTTLPSIKYRPQLYEGVDYPATDVGQLSDLAITSDEYTFVLCIGASGMPKPVEEVYTADKPFNNNGQEAIGPVDVKTIIDRQPSTCNVSVVGTYKETIYPCFPKDTSSVNFINGRLTEPYFLTAPGNLVPNPLVPLAPRVNTVDISQLGQVVHTTDTGVIGVGALNTDVGA